MNGKYLECGRPMILFCDFCNDKPEAAGPETAVRSADRHGCRSAAAD